MFASLTTAERCLPLSGDHDSGMKSDSLVALMLISTLSCGSVYHRWGRESTGRLCICVVSAIICLLNSSHTSHTHTHHSQTSHTHTPLTDHSHTTHTRPTAGKFHCWQWRLGWNCSYLLIQSQCCCPFQGPLQVSSLKMARPEQQK